MSNGSVEVDAVDVAETIDVEGTVAVGATTGAEIGAERTSSTLPAGAGLASVTINGELLLKSELWRVVA
ncbi:MAG: hypothetical protein ABL898_01280 [Hyphomicrobiaceae bacterium]